MINKISITMLVFLFCQTIKGQNAGQIDISFQPNETQVQSLSFELTENTLHVKGSLCIYDADADQLAYKVQADSVYLKIIYKKNVNQDIFFTADVDFSIPGCSEDTYIIMLDADSDGYTTNDFSTKVIRSSLTITYEIGPKREKQNLQYSLDNNKLNIKGYLFTNCCGYHSLICKTVANEITIERYDAEPLCDCEEAHLVDVSIPECMLASYNVHLLPYMDDLPDTREDVIVSDPNGINVTASKSNFIQYDNGLCHVELPHSVLGVWKIDLFDVTGKKLITKKSTKSRLTFSLAGFTSKEYICQITCDKKIYTQKIIIP